MQLRPTQSTSREDRENAQWTSRVHPLDMLLLFFPLMMMSLMWKGFLGACMSAKVVPGLRGGKNQIPSPYARRKGLKKRQLSLMFNINFLEKQGILCIVGRVYNKNDNIWGKFPSAPLLPALVSSFNILFLGCNRKFKNAVFSFWANFSLLIPVT